MMDVENRTGLVSRRSHKALFISVFSTCAIFVIGVGAYFIATGEKSAQLDSESDTFLGDSTPQTSKWVHNEEIKIFRKYLRFPTVSLESDFGPCVKFLKNLAHELDLKVSVNYPANERNPVVLMTWEGSQPKLPSILLNSHMDVVPIYEEYWTHPPFAAEMDENGNIYARGAQDMKSVGMQYLASIRALKRRGVKRLKRTVHLTFVPDEETGGEFGMSAFVKTNEFKNLNVGCGLDEGYPSSTGDLEVFYAERPIWWLNITAYGHSGHALLLFKDTAGEKLIRVIDKFMEFRGNEIRKLNDLNYPYGNVTSINLTMLKGGIKKNIIPAEMNAFIDMRLGINTDWDELQNTINRWVNEAGGNITVDIHKGLNPKPTPVDNSNPYWIAFKTATEQLQLNVTPVVFRGATDSRYLRDINISALGFSPLMNTVPMLHEHNEYINAETYLKGITIYQKIIETMANTD